MSDALNWDYLPLETAPAARQMAIDAELLDACANHRLTAALRLYRMVPGAVTIGRHQRWRTVIDEPQLAGHKWEWTRRPTGGGALLHHHEVNYAVVISRASIAKLGGAELRSAFGVIMRGFVAALESLGVHPVLQLGDRERTGSNAGSSHGLCERALTRHEVSVDGLKAIASAQLIHPDAILQHGTLYFQKPGMGDRFWPKAELEETTPKWWDLNGLIRDDPPGWARLETIIKAGFERVLGIQFHDHRVLPIPDARLRERLRAWADVNYDRHR